MAIDPQFISIDDVEDFAAIGGEDALEPELRTRLDAVRIAPRIAAQAAAGEVLVSDAVRALDDGAIQLAPRGELPGEGAPIHAAIAGE